MRKAIKNYADPTAAATASDAVTYTVNKYADSNAVSEYNLTKVLTAEQLKNLTAVEEVKTTPAEKSESTKKSSGKSKKAIYIALAVVAVVAAIFIIRKK